MRGIPDFLPSEERCDIGNYKNGADGIYSEEIQILSTFLFSEKYKAKQIQQTTYLCDYGEYKDDNEMKKRFEEFQSRCFNIQPRKRRYYCNDSISKQLNE